MRAAFSFLLVAVLAGGCGGSPVDDPGGGAGGKTDDVEAAGYPIRLERTTPAELASYFAERMGIQLDNCFAYYQEQHDAEAVMITQRVLDNMRSNYPYTGVSADSYCYDVYDLRSITTELLEQYQRQRAYPEEIKEWFEPWALEALKPAVVDGYVRMKNLPLTFYDDLVTVQDQNAMKREQNPTGVDLQELRETWQSVGNGNLDKDYLNPVILDPAALETNELWSQLRAEFPLSGASYFSSGLRAVDDFWQAGEGPEGDPRFAPIAEALKQPSITKRFYFSGSRDQPFGWSTNVLLVLDEHGQFFGLQMGYSE